MKKIIPLAGILFFLLPSSAMAHVLVKDKTGTKGAILHIQPDDDPIAGEQATLYFDTQSKNDSRVVATITNDASRTAETLAPVQTDGSLATILYTFPTQGTYILQFNITTASNSYTFVAHKRISRGATANTDTTQTYFWTEALMLGSSIGLLFLAILLIQRRKEIAQRSKL